MKLFLFVQSGIVLVVALLLAISYGNLAAGFSGLVGGVISITANAIFAAILFQYQGAHASQQIAKAFYRGEVIKIIVTALLFVIVFKWIPVYFLPLFLGYIAAQMTFWFAPFIFKPCKN